MAKPELTIEQLQVEAALFAADQSVHVERELYGVTDGKAIGTLIERRFHDHLSAKYNHVRGSSSSGRDLPALDVDLKATRASQPQSSCPYRSATQKVYGLGYSLLIFVYEKKDDDIADTGQLLILDTVFVHKSRTADYQTTMGIRSLIKQNAGVDEIIDFLEERRLPVDPPEARRLAKRILKEPPAIGYLTISNALQWRLQYGRVVEMAGTVDGINDVNLLKKSTP
ncbi:hypothetical protein LF1_22550 [Rubripirellula obstinata]|uniref:Restriction endonuclease n=1 Tax=Rubripirellula obstinata TaxID=406547 RepID=A0A5B1CEY5_9BACT|nr:restriction endonuclease [Rubripirellula obstinata]KAA1259718.1 hypothetical protein LF1_22550 [Rubripirellula obstinata]